MFDAVLLFAQAITALSRDKMFLPPNVSCDSEEVWRTGRELYDYLHKVRLALRYRTGQTDMGGGGSIGTG